MRISDWSSDVCSSDLNRLALRIPSCLAFLCQPASLPISRRVFTCKAQARSPASFVMTMSAIGTPTGASAAINPRRKSRSEEHTYELQSLMRISYADFCLKHKPPRRTHKHQADHYHTTPSTHENKPT